MHISNCKIIVAATNFTKIDFMKTSRLVLCIFCLFAIGFLQAQPVKQWGQLQVKGTQLCDAKGNNVVLRGMSFGWHNFWPRFYNEGAVSWLRKDWNCSVIRAAMGIEPRQGYKEKQEWSKEKIKTVVEAAIKEDMYVIIDWHSHNINLAEAK